MSFHVCEHSCGKCQVRCHRQNHSGTTVAAAIDILQRSASFALGSECVTLEDALCRIASQDTAAQWDLPSFDSAVHDGIAVVRDQVFGDAGKKLMPGSYQRVGMGDAIASPYDTVLPYELCAFEEDGAVRINGLSDRGEGIALRGSNIRRGDLVVPRGCKLQPSHLAILRYTGNEQVSVYRKPHAAVIPVGRDLCRAGETPGPGRFPEADGILAASVVRLCGGSAKINSPVPDTLSDLETVISREIQNCDLLILSGGVGMGGCDYGDITAKAVDSMGTVLVHGINIGPGGKAALLGVIQGKPVLGLPGPPHAALLMAEQLIPACMERFTGCPCYERPKVQAVLGMDMALRGSSGFMPHVHVSWEEGRYTISPIRMGDNVETFVKAEGIARYAAGTAYQKGGLVEVELLRSERALQGQSTHSPESLGSNQEQ